MALPARTPTASASAAFDRAAFIRSADQICVPLTLLPGERDYQSYDDVRAALRILVQTSTLVNDGLAALSFPPGEQGQQLHDLLVVRPAADLVTQRQAGDELDAAIRLRNQGQTSDSQKLYYHAAHTLVAVGAAPAADPGGVLAAYGFHECADVYGDS